MYYLTMTIVYVAIGIQECTISNPFAILAPPRDGRELAEFTATTWVRYVAWNALCLLSLAIAFTAVSLQQNAHLSMGLAALLFALPLLLLRESIRRFAFARLRLTTAVFVDATSSAVQLRAYSRCGTGTACP